MLSGFAIAILPLLPAINIDKKKKYKITKNPIQLPAKYPFIIAGIIFSIFIFIKLYDGIQTIPFGSYADMMQFMDIQCERFLNREIIYKTIPTHWNIYPPHFPAYWLPFVPLKYFNLDLRWATIILLIASFWLVLLSVLKLQRNNFMAAMPIFISAFFYFNYLIQKNTGFITITHEGIALFYYALLGYALVHKKSILIGIAMALCLLSRFYIIAFVPLYFLYSCFFADKKQTKIQVIAFMIVMIICGLPFFIQTPTYFFYVPTQYKIVDANLWKVDFKTILNGYGLAKYFHQNQYELVNKMNVIFPIIIPILFFAIMYFKKLFNKIKPNLIALSGIKLLMCFFYAIVQAPYSYLFLVPALFSYFVVFSYSERNNCTAQTSIF